MSSIFNNFVNSIFGSEGYLRSQQHASRLYRDDGFYNFAPKAGWLYYVVLTINPAPAVSREISSIWTNKYQKMVGILAKSVQMPGFKITTEVLNQYNRKTVVQTKLNYEPVTLQFHDDMANATNDLWKNYYQYYYADGAYESKKRQYKTRASLGQFNGSTVNPSFGDTKAGSINYKYGFNKPHEAPFFNDIEIYQLNRQQYTGIKLINPVITSWQHGELNQSTNQLLESKMTIAYESVEYSSGIIKGNVDIIENHYDTVPSPNRPGGALGAIAGASDVFGTISNFSDLTTPLDVLQAGIQISNVAKTVKNITSDSLKQEGYSIIAGGLGALAAGGRSSSLTAVDRILNNPATVGTVNLFRNADNSSVNGKTTAKPFGGS
jgi:hypothetical protein